MVPTIHSDQSPLRLDEHSVLRVGDSQVLLDVVIGAYNNGAEPEAIARGYPSLQLADVHAAIAYYLRHSDEIDAYLSRRRQEAESLRREIEGKQTDRATLRAKLSARRDHLGRSHAPSGE